MKRSTVVVVAVLILSLLTMGCSLCSLVQRQGSSVVQTAVATVQTMAAEQLTAAPAETSPASAVGTATPKPAEPQAGTVAPEGTPPAGGEGVAQTLPKPEDAESLAGTLPPEAMAMAQGSDVDLYQTRLSTQEVIDFMTEKMPAAGWSAEENMSMGEMGLLVYSKEGKSANILIVQGQGEEGTIVVVMVE